MANQHEAAARAAAAKSAAERAESTAAAKSAAADEAAENAADDAGHARDVPMSKAEAAAAARDTRVAGTRNTAVLTAAEKAREQAAIDAGILLQQAEDKANARPTPEARRLETSQAEEISDLKARLAQLAALVEDKTAGAISAQAVADIVQPVHPITDGGTIRPEKGPLHTTAGTQLFNPHRPTGRAG